MGGSLFSSASDLAEDEAWEWQGLPKILLAHQEAEGGCFFGLVREGADPGRIRVGGSDLHTLLTGPSEEAEELSGGENSGRKVQLALQGGLEQKWKLLVAAGEVEAASELRLPRFWRKISLSMDPRRDEVPAPPLGPPSTTILSYWAPPGPEGKTVEACELTLLSRVYSNPSLRRGVLFLVLLRSGGGVVDSEWTIPVPCCPNPTASGTHSEWLVTCLSASAGPQLSLTDVAPLVDELAIPPSKSRIVPALTVAVGLGVEVGVGPTSLAPLLLLLVISPEGLDCLELLVACALGVFPLIPDCLLSDL